MTEVLVCVGRSLWTENFARDHHQAVKLILLYAVGSEHLLLIQLEISRTASEGRPSTSLGYSPALKT